MARYSEILYKFTCNISFILYVCCCQICFSPWFLHSCCCQCFLSRFFTVCVEWVRVELHSCHLVPMSLSQCYACIYVAHYCKEALSVMLWHCWFNLRKSIRPVINWVMRCCRGYLSGVRWKWFAYGPADAIATVSSLASLKSKMI